MSRENRDAILITIGFLLIFALGLIVHYVWLFPTYVPE